MGSQKNFDRFMAALTPADGQEAPLPDRGRLQGDDRQGQALSRRPEADLRPMFQAFQANVTAYTLAVLSEKLGARIDLDRIWAKQAVSPELMGQIAKWAKEVNDTLHATSGGRMVSEWAKRPECKDAVMGASYSEPADGIPEVKAS
jgi:hypothetical protein